MEKRNDRTVSNGRLRSKDAGSVFLFTENNAHLTPMIHFFEKYLRIMGKKKKYPYAPVCQSGAPSYRGELS